VRSGLDMAEEREVGGGEAAVTRGEQVEENERNQEKSKRPNVPIVVSNHSPPNGLKTAVPVTIHAAMTASSSDTAHWQAPINSFKLAAANCTESRGVLPMEEHLDVFRQKPVRVSVKVNVPVAEHPKFNFVGKLLGPRGSSLKRLQERTRTRMAVFGSGSVRSRQKEEELLASGDPKYAHLKQPLHLQISALAAPAEAHLRIATALTEVRPYLIPDSNDLIRQRQRQELNESRPHACSCPRNPTFSCAPNSSPSQDQQWTGACKGISECNSVNQLSSPARLDRPLDSLGRLLESRSLPRPGALDNPGKSLDSPGTRLPSVESIDGGQSAHLADNY